MKQSCALFKAKPNWGSLQASVLPLVHPAERATHPSEVRSREVH